MLFPDIQFIGIDPTGKKPFVCMALDSDLTLTNNLQGSVDTLLAFLAAQESAVVGVTSPRRTNQGLLGNEAIRGSLTPPPRPGRWLEYRLVEYILRRHRINVTRTPSQENACPGWMRAGFSFYQRLEQIGYQAYPAANSHRQYLEVYPHATYTILLGHQPLPKHNLEGRLQRQLVLFENGCHLPDPMRFFEEITRHRLIHGHFPYSLIKNPAELDALAAAYTAWYLHNRPGEFTMIGDPAEGQIALPVRDLKTRYPKIKP